MALGIPFARVTLDNYVRKWKPETEGGPIYSLKALPGQLLIMWNPLERDRLRAGELVLPLSPELYRTDPVPGFIISAAKELDKNGIPLPITSRMTLQSALQSIHPGYRTWATATTFDPRNPTVVHIETSSGGLRQDEMTYAMELQEKAAESGLTYEEEEDYRRLVEKAYGSEGGLVYDRPGVRKGLYPKLIRATIVPWVHASCIVHVIKSCFRVQAPWKRLQPTLLTGEHGDVSEKIINAQEGGLRAGSVRCPPPFTVMPLREAEQLIGARYDVTLGRLVKAYTSRLRSVAPAQFSDEQEPIAVDTQGRVQAAWVRILAARYLQLVDTLVIQGVVDMGMFSTRESLLRAVYQHLNGRQWNIVVNDKDIRSAGLTQQEIASTALSSSMIDQVSVVATRIRTPKGERIEGVIV